MKLTKTLTLAAIVAAGLILGTTASQAQDDSAGKPAGAQAGHGMHGHPNIDQIAKNLKLTDDQKTQFKAALDEEQTKMKDLRKDTSLSKEDKRAKIKEIHQATETKIKGILTPEQLKKWQKEMKQKRKGKAKSETKPDSSTN